MTYESEVLADSPTQYWRCDQAGLGMVPEPNLGISGSPAWDAAWTGGAVAAPSLVTTATTGAGLCSNSDGFVTTTGLDPKDGSSLGAIEAWFKPALAGFITGSVAFNVDGDGLYVTDGGVVFAVHTTDGDFTVSHTMTTIGVGKLHVVGTYSSISTDLLLYVNGVQVASAVATGSWISSSAGTDFVSAGFDDVTLDEVAIYSGSLLSPARVAAHYAAAAVTSPPVTSGGSTPGVITPGLCAGTLTIAGVSMHTAAWDCIDLMELWFPPPTRGGNVLIPGAQGKRPYPLRADEGRYSLPMVITGVCDQVGLLNADPYLGLQQNLAALAAVFVNDPTINGLTAALVMPDSSVLTALVQVASVKPGSRVGPVMRATLELVIPAGGFA